MSEYQPITTISVLIEHIPDDHITVGNFQWPIANPIETYNVNVSPHITFELDTAFPVRLARILIEDTADQAEQGVLSPFVGEDVGRALRTAQLFGILMLQTTLTPSNRIAFARLQRDNAATPPTIKNACEAMLAGAHLID